MTTTSPWRAIFSIASSPRPRQRALGKRHQRIRHREQRHTVSRRDLRLFSRFIVGWAVSAVNDRHLTSKPWNGVKRRCPEIGLLTTPTRAGTYASEDTTLSRSAASSVQHEPPRQLLGQRRHGELLLVAQDRARRTLRERGTRRWRYLITSKCSTTSGADIRRRVYQSGGIRTGARKRAWTPWKTTQNVVSHRAPHPSSSVSGTQERTTESDQLSETVH